MSSIFKTPSSLEGHVIQFSPGAQALITAPSPPPFQFRTGHLPTYVPSQVDQTPGPTLRPHSRPLAEHEKRGRGRKLREPFWLLEISEFFFPVPVGLSSVPSRPQCGGDDE